MHKIYSYEIWSRENIADQIIEKMMVSTTNFRYFYEEMDRWSGSIPCGEFLIKLRFENEDGSISDPETVYEEHDQNEPYKWYAYQLIGRDETVTVKSASGVYPARKEALNLLGKMKISKDKVATKNYWLEDYGPIILKAESFDDPWYIIKLEYERDIPVNSKEELRKLLDTLPFGIEILDAKGNRTLYVEEDEATKSSFYLMAVYKFRAGEIDLAADPDDDVIVLPINAIDANRMKILPDLKAVRKEIYEELVSYPMDYKWKNSCHEPVIEVSGINPKDGLDYAFWGWNLGDE